MDRFLPRKEILIDDAGWGDLILGGRATGIVVATGASSGEGKYRFVGVPNMNYNLIIEEPGKFKRYSYISVPSRIQGVAVYPGLVVPFDLTVPLPQAPAVTYGIIAMPPHPEYKPVVYPPYVGVPPQKAKRIFV